MSIHDKAAAVRGKFEMTSRTKRFTIAGVIAAFVAILALAPTTGAYFSDSDTGGVEVTTGTLKLSLSDNYGSPQNDFNLNFANLTPGGPPIGQNFTAKNVGTVTALLKIGQPVTNASLVIPPGQTPDLSQLTITIPGYLNDPTPVTALPPYINLGQLNRDQQVTYTVFLALSAAAGNEWQGVIANGMLTAILEQKTT